MIPAAGGSCALLDDSLWKNYNLIVFYDGNAVGS